MSCNKKCNCNNCEMIERAHLLLIDDSNPFNEVRMDIYGFHCLYTGRYDVDTPSLKKGGFLDDLVYASEHKIVADYIKAYTL